MVSIRNIGMEEIVRKNKILYWIQDKVVDINLEVQDKIEDIDLDTVVGV